MVDLGPLSAPDLKHQPSVEVPLKVLTSQTGLDIKQYTWLGAWSSIASALLTMDMCGVTLGIILM